MFLSQSSVLKLYTSVIEDVINGVREAFIDEGVDEQVLQELKQIWESKLLSSKALEQPDPAEPQPPLINSQKAIANIPGKPLNSAAQMTNSHPQIALTDFNKPVPIQITLPAQVGSVNTQPRTLTIQVPASALHGNQLHSVLTGPVISATMALPTHVAEAVLQSHVTANLQGQAISGSLQLQQQQQQQQGQQQSQQQSHQVLQAAGLTQEARQSFTHHQLQNSVPQLDGQHDSSDDEDEEEEEEDDDNDDDDNEDKDEEENDENEAGAEEMEDIEYIEHIEDKGSKWRQYAAGVAACLSLVASGAWFTWPAPLLPRLVAPLSPVPMTPAEASWMVSFVEVGTLLSPFPASYFSDSYGRKLCILLCAPLFLIALALMIVSKTWVSLCVARIIQGISMGIPYTILPLYLGEIASPEVRGIVTSFFHIAWSLGCLFPYLVGPFLDYDIFNYVTFLLTVIFVVCFICQPESPYYYAMKDDSEGTIKMLKRLRESPSEELLKREVKEIYLEVKKETEVKVSWKDVFATPADRKALLLIFIVGVVSYLSGHNAILTYSTDTFTKFPNTIISADVVTILIGTIALAGSIFSIFTSDSCGRRFILLVSSIGCTLTLVVAALFFFLETNTEVDVSEYTWAAPFAVIAFNFFVTAGMHPVCVTYTSELFPTRTRGLASSFSSVNLTFCSFIVLKFYEPISSAMGVYFIYLCYATTCFVGTILFYFMMPETKGKTFLEIRLSLVKSSR